MTFTHPRIDYFPIPASVNVTIKESFGRIYIPETNPPRKYARARSCCVKVAGYTCPGHCGTDISARVGTIIRAPWTGKVELVKGDSHFGWTASVVRKGTDIEMFFAHCGYFYAGIDGHTVAAGEPIAKVGTTGQTSGGHSHAETREVAGNWCSARPNYKPLVASQYRMRNA